jgi:uncharacterized coiled-coil DUF342 family protein
MMDISNLKKQARDISNNLRDLGSKKEQKYREKTKLDSALNQLIKEAVELKTQKREYQKRIANLKKERNIKNKAVQEGLKKLRDLRDKYVKESRKPKLDAKKLRKDLENLNFDLETGTLSQKKEKELMNKINELKTKIKSIPSSTKTDYNRIRRKTKKFKIDSDKIHMQIQSEAKLISKIFDRLTEISNQISNIKKQRNLVKIILYGMKDQINIMNAKLGGVLSEMSKFPGAAARSALDMFTPGKDRKIKIRAGEKLTKDDILKLQKRLMKK